MRKWRTSARGRTPRRPTSAWLVGLLLAAGPVGAQLPNIPLDRPGEREMPVPRREAPPPKFTVPPLESTEAPLGESGLRVLARGFQFVGNTAFSDAELNRIVAQYIGREIGTQDLEAMRLALTKYYVDRGYVNSGAVVPDQEVVGGVITLRLVEGTLSGIEISGNRRLAEAYLRDRVMLGAATPLNVYKIRDQLFILQQDPRIKRVNAALLPGLRPGEALLRLDVEEQPSRSVHVGVDNRRPPSVGAERAEVEFNDYNFLGYADTFNARYGLTEGLNDVDVSYAFPIDVHDTAITARYVRSDSTVIEAPFDALDVKSETTSAALGVWRPYVKTPAKEYGVGLTFEQRRNQTFLLGEPFAFSPGADANGVSRVAALRLQAAWLTHNPQRIFAGRSTLSFGTGALHCGFVLRDRRHDFDLRGRASIKLTTIVSGFHRVRPVIALDDGTVLIGDQAEGSTADFHQYEISFSDCRWLKLDPDRGVTLGATWVEPDLSRVEAVGVFDVIPGSGQWPIEGAPVEKQPPPPAGGWIAISSFGLWGQVAQRE